MLAISFGSWSSGGACLGNSLDDFEKRFMRLCFKPLKGLDILWFSCPCFFGMGGSGLVFFITGGAGAARIGVGALGLNLPEVCDRWLSLGIVMTSSSS